MIVVSHKLIALGILNFVVLSFLIQRPRTERLHDLLDTFIFEIYSP